MRIALRRGLTVSATAVTALIGTAGVAVANDCANFSRVAPACYYSQSGCTSPYVRGNWVFLPSVDSSLPPIWGFGPPENFTNGQSEALTALADLNSGGAVCATPNRQFDPTLAGVHGVLSTEACWFG
jgi:hypothetical protein